jgi:CheY-like chemotaxis protein
MAERYVLVVEDERPVRDVVVRWVTELGYSVQAVESADEAITMIAGERPFAVIADVMMPRRDGRWLLERIRARWTSLPVIMASGAWLEGRC